MRNSVSQTITVSSFQTAESLGSGLLPVFSTPALVANEGRGYSFELVATDESGDRVGEGLHERVLIDVEKFMSKVK